ncbi:hypothetical protein AALB51_04455 [Lachnospiraceae bacterium 62-26]
MNIEIKPRNQIEELFNNFHSKLENILFSIVQKLPESLIPSFLMTWLDRYTTKRTQQLQQEIIRQQWQQIYLEKAVKEIRSIRQTKEAQTKD